MCTKFWSKKLEGREQFEGGDWSHLVQNRNQRQDPVNKVTIKHSGSIKCEEFLD
jgi:hypothetical protein